MWGGSNRVSFAPDAVSVAGRRGDESLDIRRTACDRSVSKTQNVRIVS